MGIEFSSAVNFGNEGPGLPKEAVALADLLARYRRDIYAIRADVAALRTLGGSPHKHTVKATVSGETEEA